MVFALSIGIIRLFRILLLLLLLLLQAVDEARVFSVNIHHSADYEVVCGQSGVVTLDRRHPLRFLMFCGRHLTLLQKYSWGRSSYGAGG